MVKIGAYKVFDNKNIIIEYYSGEITVDDFLSLKERISKEPNYNFFSDTILDIRDANLKVSETDLLKLFDFLHSKFSKEEGKRKTAYLTNSPNDVVQSTLFSNLLESKKLNVNPRIFSTMEGVVSWFDNPDINKEILETILYELKAQPNNVFN